MDEKRRSKILNHIDEAMTLLQYARQEVEKSGDMEEAHGCIEDASSEASHAAGELEEELPG
jgi:hypothetical protein